MAIALISSSTPVGGTNGGTTASINTTGANFLVAYYAFYNGSPEPTFTDSASNTWESVIELKMAAGNDVGYRLLICRNPTTSATHTVTASGTNSYATVTLMAFSGVGEYPVEQIKFHPFVSNGTSIACGNVTPSVDNCLLLTFHAHNGIATSTQSISTGFTLDQDYASSASRNGVAQAYEIQTTATTRNATWSSSGGQYRTACAVIIRSTSQSSTAKLKHLSTTISASNLSTNKKYTYFDSTDVNLLAVQTAEYYNGTADTIDQVSDNQGNAWELVSTSTQTNVLARTWICRNPTTSTNHRVRFPNQSGGFSTNTLTAWVISGTKNFNYQVAESGSNATSISATLTPAANNAILLASCCYDTGTQQTIDNSFLSGGDSNYTSSYLMGAMNAYRTQTTAASITPTVSTGSMNRAISFVAITFEDLGWYDTSWPYRTKLTIRGSKVETDVSDFPVYLPTSILPTHFHDNCTSDLGDLRITKADGTTEVAREIVSYNQTTTEGEVHFSAEGTLSANKNTIFYLYYGNTSANDYAVDATYGAQNVWNDYISVYHMSAASGNESDSAVAGNTLTETGGTIATATDDYVKFIGGSARDFEAGDTEWFENTTASVFNFASNSFTLSCWTYAESLVNFPVIMRKRYNATSSNSYALYYHTAVSAMAFSIYTGSSDFSALWTNSDSAGYWVCYQDDSNSIIGIKNNNGTFATTALSTSRAASSTGSSQFGASDHQSLYWDGSIDEFRLAQTIFDNDRLDTEYNNQSDPSQFFIRTGRSVFDSFTDANSTSLASHIPEDGGSWTNLNGTWTITSNKAVAPGSTTAASATIPCAADGFLRVNMDVPNTGNYIGGFCLRVTDIDDYWIAVLQRDGGQPYLGIYSYVAGTSTLVASRLLDTSVTNTNVNLYCLLYGNTILLGLDQGTTSNVNVLRWPDWLIYTSASTGASNIDHGLYGTTNFSYSVPTFKNFEFIEDWYDTVTLSPGVAVICLGPYQILVTA